MTDPGPCAFTPVPGPIGGLVGRAAETVPIAILAGGRGERLWPETADMPKPLVPIGGIPILRHVVDGFVAAGCADIVVALGHRGDAIRAAFGGQGAIPAIRFVDTGERTGTGGRLRRLRRLLGGARVLVAYADGLADLDVGRLIAFHRRHGRQATVVAVPRPERFGRLVLDRNRVVAFMEKQAAAEDWISGGFFVLERAVLDRLPARAALSFEADVMPALAAAGEVRAYRHRGFWQCMDMPAERQRLEALWRTGRPPWRR